MGQKSCCQNIVKSALEEMIMSEDMPEAKNIRVRNIMTTEVFSVHPETSVGEIARIMSAHAISGLPVVDANDRVVGVVTERDMIMRNTRFKLPTYIVFFESVIPLETHSHYRERLEHSLGTTASEIMSEPAVTVAPDAGLEELAEIMVDRGMNPIPVVEAGRLVGIVSRADVVRLMAIEFDHKTKP
jgi:CBS domain-containing protein